MADGPSDNAILIADPDHKTIADFRKDNGRAIRRVCAQFVQLCRQLGLLAAASVAIDGSKFKAVNNRDRNFTRAKMQRRLLQIEDSVARYLHQLDTADRQEPSEALAAKTEQLKEKIGRLKQEMVRLEGLKARMLATPELDVVADQADPGRSLTDPDGWTQSISRSMAPPAAGDRALSAKVAMSTASVEIDPQVTI